jgi:hypothetical protein
LIIGSGRLCSTTNSITQYAVQPVSVLIHSLYNKNGATCDQDHQCHVFGHEDWVRRRLLSITITDDVLQEELSFIVAQAAKRVLNANWRRNGSNHAEYFILFSPGPTLCALVFRF